jgi:hypothetical protein
MFHQAPSPKPFCLLVREVMIIIKLLQMYNILFNLNTGDKNWTIEIVGRLRGVQGESF